MTTTLQTRVRSADDGVAVIELTGDVTAACENELMDAYREAGRAEIQLALEHLQSSLGPQAPSTQRAQLQLQRAH